MLEEKKGQNYDESVDSMADKLKKVIGVILEKKNEGDSGASVSIQNLNLIYHNDGIVTGNNANMQEIDIQKEGYMNPKQEQTRSDDTNCFIANHDTLMAWFTEHYEDYEMAFIIALAVFEKMPYLWVYTIAEDLYALLEQGKEGNQSVKEKIANTNRINNIGAKTYPGIVLNHTGKTENIFICFQSAEYFRNILECVWDEYIFLRETMIKWLAEYISDQNYSKAIRAIKALAIFAQLDFDYFNREVIPKLFSKKSFMSDYAIAQIFLQVNHNEKYQKNIENIYLHWAKLPNIHYIFTALMIGIANKWTQSIMEIAIERYLHKMIQEISNGTTKEYVSELSTFFSIGQRKAVYFKAIVAVLYDELKMYEGWRQRFLRISVGMCFFSLLCVDNSQSNIDVQNMEKHKEMIFVKMCLISNDSVDTTLKVRQLWKFIWTNKELRGSTRALLEQYLYQFGGCGSQQVKDLRNFLYSFLDTEDEGREMDYFLRKIAMRRTRPILVAEKIIH